jgi:excisionase family DNA binding protein
MEVDTTLAVTVTVAARRLSVSQRLVEKMIADGRMRVVRLGRRVVVPVAELERLLADVSQ